MASCEDCCGPGGCGPGAKPSRVIDFGVPAFDRRGTVVMEDGSQAKEEDSAAPEAK